jgi:release factor glutamine methyltransferase
MKIRDYRTQFIERLKPIYDTQEAESFFYLVLENKRQLKRIDLALQPDLAFTGEDIKMWDLILAKLESEIPVQYILNEAVFFGLKFFVNEDVLIPRPETEELVDWILSENNHSKGLKILDIGTGSGCIAISLAKMLPSAKVFAIDISEKALSVAKRNAEINAVSINFICRDILKTERLEKNFDVIVSNPPYVRNLEKHEIRRNVLESEPHLALFVDDNDALVFYRKISGLAKNNLVTEGKLYFEINQYLGNEMLDLLREDFKNVDLRKDIYGNDRMIKAEI